MIELITELAVVYLIITPILLLAYYLIKRVNKK
jgi:hypothetical protein